MFDSDLHNILLIKHKIQQRMDKENATILLHNLKNYVTDIKSSKKS